METYLLLLLAFTVRVR